MRKRLIHPGITLTETIIVVAAAAILLAISMPAAKKFQTALESQSGVTTIVSSAIASAKAIAAKNQRYAGIRFQKVGSFGIEKNATDLPQQDKVLNADQYIIFIIQEEPKKMGNVQNAFKAVPGVEPIKLPASLGVMDLRVRSNRINEKLYSSNPARTINSNLFIDEEVELIDTTSFSIIFSPSGKLVIHRVRLRNRDGLFRPENYGDDKLLSDETGDDIFNSPENMEFYDIGMFIQDDYAYYGLGEEYSRNSFIIFQKDSLNTAFKNNNAYTGYLQQLTGQRVYINPYSGKIIDRRTR